MRWDGDRDREKGTFATDAEVSGTDLVAELAFLLAGHFLVLFGAGTPVLWLEDLEGRRVLAGAGLLVLLFGGGGLSDSAGHDGALAGGPGLCHGGIVGGVGVVVVAKVGEGLGRGGCADELGIDGEHGEGGGGGVRGGRVDGGCGEVVGMGEL